jgi:hypothetical protein
MRLPRKNREKIMSLPSPSTPRALDTASLPSVRAQSAVVRSLRDAIEYLAARGDSADGLREQLVEELERLHLQQAAATSR